MRTIGRLLKGFGVAMAAIGLFVVVTEIGVQTYRSFRRVSTSEEASAGAFLSPYLSYEYRPFRMWQVSAQNIEKLHVESSGSAAWRATENPACGEKVATEIWVLGASVAWGWNHSDQTSIPSLLSGLLNKDSQHCYTVKNYAIPSYVSNQELLTLVELLKTRPAPHSVVFLNGANDVELAGNYAGAAATHPYYRQIKERIETQGATRQSPSALWRQLVSRWYEDSFFVERFHRLARSRAKPEGLVGYPSAAGAAKEALDNYEANLKMINVLGKAYGFRPLTFFQPVQMYPEKKAAHWAGAHFDEVVYSGYAEAEARSSRFAHFVFLGRLLESNRFTDWVHPNLEGNRAIAERIARELVSTEGLS